MHCWHLLGIFSKFNDSSGHEIVVFKIHKISMVCRVDRTLIGSYSILLWMCLILRYELHYLCSRWIPIAWTRYYLLLNTKCVPLRSATSVGVILVYKVNGAYRCSICTSFEGFIRATVQWSQFTFRHTLIRINFFSISNCRAHSPHKEKKNYCSKAEFWICKGQ